MPKRSREYHKNQQDRAARLAQELGERLRLHREQLKLTQAQVRSLMLQEHVYISRTQYSRIERGESLVNVVELVGVARALRIDYVWLLEGDGNQ